ncbi:hypothetical protein CLIB1423_22S00540 [[Candida] railenensis]|uniref:Uncharacterized protein n=1 Tax=[Candida] railenensis TaxID=45579 RepID=A0A9P0W0K8_9ASCO|nr:hypothetical protein CLIB1423_22S00540 [[Candida] railenensis]
MSVATPKRQLTSRKSYSILPTVDGSGGNLNGSPQWAHGGDRILSETTGLVKFALSPNRAKKTLTTKKSGLPVYIPIDDRSSHEVEEVNILEKFAKKQRQLVELEKQIELVKFELMEMSEQIKSSHGDVNDSNKSNNNGDSSNNSSTSTSNGTGIATSATSRIVESPSKLNFLKNKASNIFNIEIQPSQAQPIQEYFNKFQNQLNQSKVIPREALKNIVNDVGKNIDENNTKIKQFINANPTTKKFNELINNLSPSRSSKVVTPSTRRDVAETSLMFDNLDLNEIKFEKSLIYEGGDSIIFEGDEELLGNSSNIVDIDDYDSEEEKL